jgi:hypothetical protein
MSKIKIHPFATTNLDGSCWRNMPRPHGQKIPTSKTSAQGQFEVRGLARQKYQFPFAAGFFKKSTNPF